MHMVHWDIDVTAICWKADTHLRLENGVLGTHWNEILMEHSPFGEYTGTELLKLNSCDLQRLFVHYYHHKWMLATIPFTL